MVPSEYNKEKEIEEKFKKLVQIARIKLKKDLDMMHATEEEFRKKADEKFKEILEEARIALKKEWNMLHSTEEEFRQRIDKRMQNILKEVRKDRKRITKIEKDIGSTIDYFDKENIKIKEFTNYYNQ